MLCDACGSQTDGVTEMSNVERQDGVTDRRRTSLPDCYKPRALRLAPGDDPAPRRNRGRGASPHLRRNDGARCLDVERQAGWLQPYGTQFAGGTVSLVDIT